MSGKNNDEIVKLIDRIQSGLVELFDQLRELRRLLGLKTEGTPDSPIEMAATGEVFSGSEGFVLGKLGVTMEKDTPARSETVVDRSSALKADRPQPSRPESARESSAAVSADSVGSGDHMTNMNATLSRLLDPIAYELRTDNASAEVIAEYVQAAKDRLIAKERPNEKVAKDMDVVLRFLKARGKRPIKPEERDNILTRVNRWKLHLSVPAP
jgi:hypothetical protein